MRWQRQHPDEANELSVQLELQADCFAGVWAHSAYERNLLENGDPNACETFSGDV